MEILQAGQTLSFERVGDKYFLSKVATHREASIPY